MPAAATSRATASGSAPRLFTPSVSSTIARVPCWGICCAASASASPIAVAPFGSGTRASAARTSSRSSVGCWMTEAPVANVTMPMRVPAGHRIDERKQRAAAFAAAMRVGATSSARIEPDVSTQE